MRDRQSASGCNNQGLTTALVEITDNDPKTFFLPFFVTAVDVSYRWAAALIQSGIRGRCQATQSAQILLPEDAR